MSKAYKCDICHALFEEITPIIIKGFFKHEDKTEFYLNHRDLRAEICPDCVKAIQCTLDIRAELRAKPIKEQNKTASDIFYHCRTCKHRNIVSDQSGSTYLVCELLNGKWTAEINEEDCPLKKKGECNE